MAARSASPAIGNKNAKNVVLFLGDGMGDSEITVARDYLKGANGHFDGLDAVGQPERARRRAGRHRSVHDLLASATAARTALSARMATASWSPTPIRASLPP